MTATVSKHAKLRPLNRALDDFPVPPSLKTTHTVDNLISCPSPHTARPQPGPIIPNRHRKLPFLHLPSSPLSHPQPVHPNYVRTSPTDAMPSLLRAVLPRIASRSSMH